MSTYWIVNTEPRERVEEFPTYDQASRAYVEAGKLDPTLSRTLAVRSSDDPAWRNEPLADFRKEAWQVKRHVYSARREAVRKEVGETARAMVAKESLGTFDGVVRAVLISLGEREYQVERFTVEDAVKSRVLLGRCRTGCDRGWFAPKKLGPLSGLRCPVCSRSLYQTSLAYQRGFTRIIPGD